MAFISYAQNHEDVILMRALENIPKGFYIDVGAAWPNKDSVTKAFYDKGWNGINIEPNPALIKELNTHRPKDINIEIALGQHPGTSVINFVDQTGLSTLKKEFSDAHALNGFNITKDNVTVRTLDFIYEIYINNIQDVHFLKIDVEGYEEQVIRGNNWSKNRPWIIVIESTLPLSKIDSHHEWEPILLAENYSFVYADGLNRFYVSNEHPELIEAFKYPPNIFDEYITHTQYNLVKRNHLLEKKLESIAQIYVNSLKNQTSNKWEIIE